MTGTVVEYSMKTYHSDLPKIEEFVQLNGKTLLELGCGDGRLTALLASKVEAITAIDPDDNSIEAARKNVNGVTFLVGSGEKLDFANESFDIVLFSYSLHHQDCVKALAEAKRVLRQDGHILIIEPTSDGEFTLLVSIFEKDEILRLQQTLDYVSSGAFNILRKETYGVDYPYADRSALYNHFMNKFMTAKDDHAVEKMEVVLGNKNNGEPIIIKDIVNIFLLGKYTHGPCRLTAGSCRPDFVSGVGRVHLHYGADDLYRRRQHNPGT
jgi:SAM-dependent methyltransferase